MIVHSNNNRNCVTGRRHCVEEGRKGVKRKGRWETGDAVVSCRDILARIGEVLESMGGRHSMPPLEAAALR